MSVWGGGLETASEPVAVARGRHAREALLAHARSAGMDLPAADGPGAEQAVADLLADLMHLAHELPVDFSRLVARGYRTYLQDAALDVP